MKAINFLLDKTLMTCTSPSDRHLSKKLGVSPSAISRWRQGCAIKDEHLALLISLTGTDPAVAVLVRLESAKSPMESKLWKQLWDKVAPPTPLA